MAEVERLLTYKLINNRPDLTRLIWDREQAGPQWWRDASRTWTPTFESFEQLWADCREIYGLFNDERLLAVIYIAYLGPFAINVHISVVDKVPEADLVRFFVSVKNKKAIEGITEMTGWILDLNRGMKRTAKAGGFEPNGCDMIYGTSRGKVLKWLQYRAV